jgi:hypothetical protein
MIAIGLQNPYAKSETGAGRKLPTSTVFSVLLVFATVTAGAGPGR